MKSFFINLEKLSLGNSYFRKVLYTGQHSQLVLMSLKPKEEIGFETHEVTDQFIRIEKGQAKVIIEDEERLVKDGDAFLIPAGTRHNVVNTSLTEELKLYTLYSPPHHKDQITHKTKKEAEADLSDHL